MGSRTRSSRTADLGIRVTSLRELLQIFGYNPRDSISSPYNSKANGKAESAVKTCKQIMRKSKDACSGPYLTILDHRNIPSQGFLSSPAQCLMSRRTKTILPTVSVLLRPEVVDARHTGRDMKRSQNQKATYYNKRASDRQVLEEGDTVRLQPFRLGRKDWSRGTVVKRLDEKIVCCRYTDRCSQT